MPEPAHIALLFPGQGSQDVGMGDSLRAASERAEQLFRLADEVTGLPIAELCAHGPKEELTQTAVAQTAIVATSLAAAALLEETLGTSPMATAVAGHSVGELAALCWAGALDVPSTLRLVATRGRLMGRDSAAVDGTMAAVLGLDEASLHAVCRDASDASGQVQVANLNAPGQVVISGERGAVARASTLATAAGAKRVLPLTVGGPFHSVYMEAAARDFSSLVQSTPFHPPRVPIVLNASAALATDPVALAHELGVQMTSAVRWEQSINTLASLGCTTFVELGAGQVLSGLVRRIVPDARVASAGTAEAIASIAEIWRKDAAAGDGRST